MRVRKTRQDQRKVYRYPVSVEDGCGGYRTVYTTVKPGEKGVTEVWIRDLHRMDDNEVANNVKNGHPKLTPEQKAEKKEWEEAHPGEKFDMNWNLSLDYIAGDTDDGELDKSSVLAGASYDPFDEDVPDEVLKLREIAATKMTDRQRQAYRLIGLEGYSRTEAAKIMGVSVKVPLVLILCSTVSEYIPGIEFMRPVLEFLGTPFVALIIAVLLAMFFLGKRQGYNGEELKKILDRSLRPTGQILLVITGGGIIRWVLQDCGMGNIIGPALEKSGLPLVLVAFLIAALIRASVGAAVVAMTMAAGIMASMPGVAELSPVYLAAMVCAINGGATAFSHVNDSGFWLVNSLLEIDEKTTLKSWTIMETIVGITGLVCAVIISLFA